MSRELTGRSEHIARMLAALTNREAPHRLSPTTVRYAHTVLRIALGPALKSGMVVRNVAGLSTPQPVLTTNSSP